MLCLAEKTLEGQIAAGKEIPGTEDVLFTRAGNFYRGGKTIQKGETPEVMQPDLPGHDDFGDAVFGEELAVARPA